MKRDLADKFTIREAAHFWYGYEPDSKEIPATTKEKIDALGKALKKAYRVEMDECRRVAWNAACARPGDPNYSKYPPSAEFHLSREQLKGIAERLGEKPVFLFSEKYAETETQAQKVEQMAEPEPENFVRNLRIFYKSDLEIKIQIPRQKAKVYSHSALGFRNADQKEWEDLLKIVKDPKHEYRIGQAYAYSGGQRTKRMKEYDSMQKRMKSINKKLVTFFNRVYGANLPSSFKLYEPGPDTSAGIYRFKLGEEVKDKNTASKYAHFTKEQIKLEIKRLSQLDTTESAEDLSLAYRQAEALEMSKSEIGELLPDTRQEDIKYDPHENEPPPPDQY